jgi:hypothetical protein
MPTARTIMSVKKCMLAGLFLAPLIPCVASAALGEPEASVQSDSVGLRGSIKVTEHAGYRLHEIQSPSGTLVREYVGAGGMVFAVAWNGPTVPNLRQTLGRYFDAYVEAAKANRLGHHQLQIRGNDLVLTARGHMRDFSGVAYLPSAVPDDVRVGDLH